MKIFTFTCIMFVMFHIGLFIHDSLRDSRDFFSWPFSLTNPHRGLDNGFGNSNALREKLDREGIPYESKGRAILIRIRTFEYQNKDGDNILDLLVLPAADQTGDIFFVAPFIYQFEENGSDQRLPVLPIAQYQLSFLQIGYDPADGEVRGVYRMHGPDRNHPNLFGSLLDKIQADLELFDRILQSAQLAQIPDII